MLTLAAHEIYQNVDVNRAHQLQNVLSLHNTMFCTPRGKPMKSLATQASEAIRLYSKLNIICRCLHTTSSPTHLLPPP